MDSMAFYLCTLNLHFSALMLLSHFFVHLSIASVLVFVLLATKLKLD